MWANNCNCCIWAVLIFFQCSNWRKFLLRYHLYFNQLLAHSIFLKKMTLAKMTVDKVFFSSFLNKYTREVTVGKVSGQSTDSLCSVSIVKLVLNLTGNVYLCNSHLCFLSRRISIADFDFNEKCRDIAARTEGLSGREIAKLGVAWQVCW